MKEWQLWLWFLAGCIVFAIAIGIDQTHHYKFKFASCLFGAIYGLFLMEVRENRNLKNNHPDWDD